MQKKILAVLLILTMLLTFAACGGSGSGDTNDGGNQDVNVNVNDGADEEETPKSKRDKTFNLESAYASCVLEYDSIYCENYDYVYEDEKGTVYILCEGGQATVKLMKNSDEEGYVDYFKKSKNAGNGSHYYVKDLVVEATDSCEVNGYKYTLYSYSYKDVYVSQNQEYENFGMFGYVQLEDSNALLIEECSFEDFAGFVESALYIKEVVDK